MRVMTAVAVLLLCWARLIAVMLAGEWNVMVSLCSFAMTKGDSLGFVVGDKSGRMMGL